jgi:hypothetical protein
MRSRGSAIIWITALAFLGMKVLPPSANPAAEAGKSTATASGPAETGPEEKPAPDAPAGDDDSAFLRPLVDFLDTGTDKRIADPIKLMQNLRVKCDPVVLIAMVPDPMDSGSGYRFDSVVDALQRAIEGQFVLDRYYFPWSPSAGQTPATAGNATVDHTLTLSPLGIRSQAHNAKRHRVYERQPATLVFRQIYTFMKNPAEQHVSNRLLIVFLVGETATGGVHRLALKSALDFLWRGLSDGLGIRPAYILGPYFSGSQTSVAMTIHDWLQGMCPPENRPEVRVVSGSATAVDKELFLKLCKPDDGQLPKKLTFDATIIPEVIVFHELLRYLRLYDSNGRLRENIALLHESNTGYGQFLKKEIKTRRVGAAASPGDKRVIFFPFPMHISQVRVGYGKAGSVAKDTLPSLPRLGRKLRIPFAEGITARDVEPSLHPAMTAVTDERVLATMLASIAHERFRYVAIAASDVKDRLFLATLVREACPDVQLLFTSAHVLMSHPDHSAYMKGAIVGSTYPLYAKNQRWSYPFLGDSQRVFLPGEAEQGCYNAAVVLLRYFSRSLAKGHLLEYGAPFTKIGPNELTPKPTVWISIIGENGPQPLDTANTPHDEDDRKLFEHYVYPSRARIVANDDEQELDKIPPASSVADEIKTESAFTPQPNSFWVTPFVAVSLFALVVGAAYGFSLWHRARRTAISVDDGVRGAGILEDRFWLVSLFIPRRGRWRRRQWFYVLVCLGSVGLLYFIAAAVVDVPLAHYRALGGPLQMRPAQWAMPGATVLLTLLFAILVVQRLVVAFKERPSGPGQPVAPALASPPADHGREPSTDPPGQTAPWALRLRKIVWAALRQVRSFVALAWHWLGSVTRTILGRPLLFLCTLLGFVAVLHLTMSGLPEWDGLHERSLFFYERATNLASGVSPVVPFSLLCLGFFWWGYARLKRLYLLDLHRVEAPFPPVNDKDFRELSRGLRAADITRLRELNRYHWAALQALAAPYRAGVGGKAWFIWLVLIFTYCRMANRFVPTVEGVLFDTVLLLGLAVFSLLLVHAVLELLSLWKALHGLLLEIAKLPMRQAFNRIPVRVTRMFGPFLSSERPGRRTHLKDRAKQRELLLKEYDVVRADLQQELGYSDSQLEELDRQLASQAVKPANGSHDTLRKTLTKTSHACVGVLRSFWKDLSLGEALGDQPMPDSPPPAAKEVAHLVTADGVTGNPAMQQTATAQVALLHQPAPAQGNVRLGHWRALAEDFVALEMVTYLSQYFVQLRNLLLFLTGGPLLLLFAVTSYPLQPQRLWLLFAGLIIVVVAVVAVRLFLQIERDDVVSRVTGGTPNRVDWLHGSFLANVMTYAVPLLAGFAAASTDLADLIHSWLDPVLQVLR